MSYGKRRAQAGPTRPAPGGAAWPRSKCHKDLRIEGPPASRLDHTPGVRARQQARNCIRRRLIAARWRTVLSRWTVMGRWARPISVRRNLITAWWWAVAGRRAVAGWRPISVRRWHVTGRWRTILGPSAVGGRRPISIRRWHVTGRWRTIFGPSPVGGRRPIIIRRPFITKWRCGHTLGSGTMRRCADGEQRCGGGNCSAKMAHDVLCLVSR
jgi:hypothetical protein